LLVNLLVCLLAGWLAAGCWLAGLVACWLFGLLACWFAGWLAALACCLGWLGWLLDVLAGWLAGLAGWPGWLAGLGGGVVPGFRERANLVVKCRQLGLGSNKHQLAKFLNSRLQATNCQL